MSAVLHHDIQLDKDRQKCSYTCGMGQMAHVHQVLQSAGDCTACVCQWALSTFLLVSVHIQVVARQVVRQWDLVGKHCLAHVKCCVDCNETLQEGEAKVLWNLPAQKASN